MHPELKLLISLEKIDHQLDLLNAELKDNEESIQKKEAQIKFIETSNSSTEEKLKEILLKLKKEEELLKGIEYKIEQKNKEYFAGKITNAKELKAFQKEVQHLKEEKDEKETNILILMEESEKLKEEIAKLKEKSEKSKKILKKDIKDLKKEIEEIEKKLEDIGEKREELVKKIDKSYYALYEDLKREKPKPIAEIKENICTGCHLVIPEQIIIKVKENEEIITCPNCGRILYWDESSSSGRT